MKATVTQTADRTWAVTVRGFTVKVIWLTREVKGRHYHNFEVRWNFGGQKHRRGFADKNKAFEEAGRIADSISRGNLVAANTDNSRLAYLLECERMLGDTPLHIAVEAYLRSTANVINKTTQEVVDEFLAKKQNEGLSKRHLDSLEWRCGLLTDSFAPRPFASITMSDLETLMDSRKWGNRSRVNFLVVMRNLFKWAQRRRYLPVGDEPAPMKLTIPKVQFKTPGIYTVEEMKTLLTCAAKVPETIPFIVIQAFAGGRRAEVQRLQFEDIDFDQRIIKLDVEHTKTKRGRRVLTIPDNLYEWLLPFRGRTGPIAQWSDPLKHLRNTLPAGFKQQHNGLRHSFCSYHLMLHRNAALTAELAGNSVSELNASYKALVTPQEAVDYYAITPTSLNISLP